MFLGPFYFYYVLVLVGRGESVLQSDGAISVVRRLGSIDQGGQTRGQAVPLKSLTEIRLNDAVFGSGCGWVRPDPLARSPLSSPC